MCVIHRYNLVHPNGAPERKENLLPCEFGSPVNPCNNTRVQHLPDYFVAQPELAFSPHRRAQPVGAGASPRLRRQEETRKFKKFSKDLKLVFDFHIPFTSRRSDKKERSASEHESVRRHNSQGRHDAQRPMRTGLHTGPAMNWAPPQGQPEHLQDRHDPQPHTVHRAEPTIIRPRRHHPLNVQIHQAGDSSSPSPPTPLREHRRNQPHNPSEVERYEELKRLIREREGREHVERLRRERAERVAQDAEEARRRAERETQRLRHENIELARAERRRLEEEEEDIRTQEHERQLQEQNARRRRRIQMEERRRIESAQLERSRREREELEREQARLRQEREDRQRLQEAAIRDRLQRDRNERERIERQRRAGIPLRPRHETEVHHRPTVSFEERGDQVIDAAIRRAEDRRRFNERVPAPGRGWPRRRDVGGGLMRRDTIAVSQRRVYEDDRRRGGRRFI